MRNGRARLRPIVHDGPPLISVTYFLPKLSNQIDKQILLSRSGCSSAVQGLWIVSVVFVSLCAHFEVLVLQLMLDFGIAKRRMTTPAGLG